MALPDVRPTVVLLHGLALSPLFMLPMARRLAAQGWAVRRIGYDSRRQGFGESVAEVRRQLPSGPIHIVGHSLGGLIGAALLRDPQGADIRRVVQMGSPNLGSPHASRVQRIAPLRWFYGPVLEELEIHDETPDRDPRIGAIAGAVDLPVDVTDGPGDGTVSVVSALAAAGDHVTVPITHSLLPLSRRVAAHVHSFLTDGRFRKGSP